MFLTVHMYVFSCTYRFLQCATLVRVRVRSFAGLKDFASGKQFRVHIHFVIVECEIFYIVLSLYNLIRTCILLYYVSYF